MSKCKTLKLFRPAGNENGFFEALNHFHFLNQLNFNYGWWVAIIDFKNFRQPSDLIRNFWADLMSEQFAFKDIGSGRLIIVTYIRCKKKGEM